MQPTVSAVVIARDEAALIAGCLASLAWADESVVVLDAATTDDTAALAEAAGARVVERPWRGFPHQRNVALALARSDWVLFVDGDELVPPSLAHEVRARLTSAGDMAGFWIPRRNIIAGEWVRHAGWWPDRQLRLLRRLSARYDEGAVVHEVATLDGPDATLSEPLLHLNYDTLAEFREKQTRFATLETHTLWDRGQRARPHNVIVQPIREFRRRIVTLGGYRQGLLGLRLGLEMARANFLTYRELLALTRADTACERRPIGPPAAPQPVAPISDIVPPQSQSADPQSAAASAAPG